MTIPFHWLTIGVLVFCGSVVSAQEPALVSHVITTDVDNAILELKLDNQGLNQGGAAPFGFTQLRLQSEDEIPNCTDPPCSSNFSAYLRSMSRQYNYNRGCLDNKCPGMTELASDGHLRLTVSDGKNFDLVMGNHTQLVFGTDARGDIVIRIPRLGLDVPRVGNYALCINSDGTLSVQPRSCQ